MLIESVVGVLIEEGHGWLVRPLASWGGHWLPIVLVLVLEGGARLRLASSNLGKRFVAYGGCRLLARSKVIIAAILIFITAASELLLFGSRLRLLSAWCSLRRWRLLLLCLLGCQVGLQIHFRLVSRLILLVLLSSVVIIAITLIVALVVVALSDAWGIWIETTPAGIIVILIIRLCRLVERALKEVRNVEFAFQTSLLSRWFSLLNCGTSDWLRSECWRLVSCFWLERCSHRCDLR